MERQQTVKLTKANSASRHTLRAQVAPQKLTPSHPVLHLQQKIGNQAVQRLLSSGGIQAKLTLSHRRDIREPQEDHVDDNMIRMPDPRTRLQTAEENEEEEKIQGKSLPVETSSLIQRRRVEKRENDFHIADAKGKEKTNRQINQATALAEVVSANSQSIPESARAAPETARYSRLRDALF